VGGRVSEGEAAVVRDMIAALDAGGIDAALPYLGAGIEWHGPARVARGPGV
jgi:hypothetical protein